MVKGGNDMKQYIAIIFIAIGIVCTTVLLLVGALGLGFYIKYSCQPDQQPNTKWDSSEYELYMPGEEPFNKGYLIEKSEDGKIYDVYFYRMQYVDIFEHGENNLGEPIVTYTINMTSPKRCNLTERYDHIEEMAEAFPETIVLIRTAKDVVFENVLSDNID